MLLRFYIPTEESDSCSEPARKEASILKHKRKKRRFEGMGGIDDVNEIVREGVQNKAGNDAE